MTLTSEATLTLRRQVRVGPWRRGMFTADDPTKATFEHAVQIMNFRKSRSNKWVKRDGNRRWTKASFDSPKFFDLHQYIDGAGNERVLVANNGKIFEVDESTKTERTDVTLDKYVRMVNALGSVFGTTGKEAFKGTTETYVKYGIKEPSVAFNANEVTSGGSLSTGKTYTFAVSFVEVIGGANTIITSYSGTRPTVKTTTGSSKIALSNLEESTNPRVTKKRIWASKGDGSVLFKLADIDNDVTTHEFTSESELDENVLFSTFQNNQGPPFVPTWFEFHDQRMWVLFSDDDPDQVYPSKRGEGAFGLELLPTNNIVRFPTKGLKIELVIGIGPHLYAMTRDDTFRLQGSQIGGKDPDGVIQLPDIEHVDTVGTISPWSWSKADNGAFGVTTDGMPVFFDGYTFHSIGNDIYPTLKANKILKFMQGRIFESEVFGREYWLMARIPVDEPGGAVDLQGGLPGSGKFGTGSGSPSENFDDNSLNTTRWTKTSVAGIELTEANKRLDVDVSTPSGIRDEYIETNYSMESHITVSVDAAFSSAVSATRDSDVRQYLMLRKDDDNNAEISLLLEKDSDEVKIESVITSDGTATTDTITSPPANTRIRIELVDNMINTYYLDSENAWQNVGAVIDSMNFNGTGWKARIGAKTDETVSVDLNYVGYFDNYRAQAKSFSGFEDITLDTDIEDNANHVLVGNLRDWQPNLRDRAGNIIGAAWSGLSMRAQRVIELQDGTTIHVDSSRGLIYRLDDSYNYDDEDFIANLFDTNAEAQGALWINKIQSTAWFIGNWGVPFQIQLFGLPKGQISTRTVKRFKGGPALGSMVLGTDRAWSAESIRQRVKFRRVKGTNFRWRVSKMDNDINFAMDQIIPQIDLSRGKK